MLVLSDWQGWANGALFRNNRFYVEGIARYGHGRKRPDGTYVLEAGPGDAQGIAFEGNLYAGKQVDRFEDATGEVMDKVNAPKVDWDAPQFDPAKPDAFDAFLARHRQWMLRTFRQQFGQPVRLGR